LNVLEIGDAGDSRTRRIELLDGSELVGAIVEGGTISLFGKNGGPVAGGEVTIPDVGAKRLLVTGLVPHATYELLFTRLGNYVWSYAGAANAAGVLYLPFEGERDGRLRLRMLSSK